MGICKICKAWYWHRSWRKRWFTTTVGNSIGSSPVTQLKCKPSWGPLAMAESWLQIYSMFDLTMWYYVILSEHDWACEVMIVISGSSFIITCFWAPGPRELLVVCRSIRTTTGDAGSGLFLGLVDQHATWLINLVFLEWAMPALEGPDFSLLTCYFAFESLSVCFSNHLAKPCWPDRRSRFFQFHS